MESEDNPPAGPSVWRFARASRAHVVVDAAAYLLLMQQAMLKARERIMMVGWDFDTRVRMGPGRRWWNPPSKTVPPARMGALVAWLCRRVPGLRVQVLKWNFGALRFLFRGSMILDLIRWVINPSINFRFDSAHPFGCSHHQKLVLIDDLFAVSGGIDLTTKRWDTTAHLDDDPRRRGPRGHAYGPWHDLTLMVEGEIAAVLGELGRERWEQAGGEALPPCQPREDTPWPDVLHAEFRDVEVGIARTRAAWKSQPEIREVEALFLEHIARARRFIYAESQYFASRSIAEAMAARLREDDPPEIVLINPVESEGWLEQVAMDRARVRLVRALKEVDHKGRFHVFCPVTSGGTPIYVHSKLLIVDDEVLRVGSANLNNRSMGMDSECDLFIDAARPGNAHAAAPIRSLRHRLLAEHCGLEEAEVALLIEREGTIAGMIATASRKGKRLEAFSWSALSPRVQRYADAELFDPERPEDLFEPIAKRRGLFRRGGLLRAPR